MFIEINRRRRWRRRVNVFNVCLFPGSAPPDKPWRGSPTPSSPGQSHTHTQFTLSTCQHHLWFHWHIHSSQLKSVNMIFVPKTCPAPDSIQNISNLMLLQLEWENCWHKTCSLHLCCAKLKSVSQQFVVKKEFGENMKPAAVVLCLCGSVSLWFCGSATSRSLTAGCFCLQSSERSDLDSEGWNWSCKFAHLD